MRLFHVRKVRWCKHSVTDVLEHVRRETKKLRMSVKETGAQLGRPSSDPGSVTGRSRTIKRHCRSSIRILGSGAF
jgi:hypothetical protein